MTRTLRIGWLIAMVLATCAGAAERRGSWDLAALSSPPASRPAEGFQAEGVSAIFYDGLPWQGKPTRVFAWIGFPAMKAGEKVPAMVLVHGGGGTAFDEWVRLWNSRGYAAIAMDTCGCVAGGQHGKRVRHEHGGPPGWGGWDQGDQPTEDQWTYHAVADVILAHSLIRSLPQVDPNRTGLTGISWGGYLTSITASIDNRFKFAAPVYGCGFLGEDSAWLNKFAGMGDEKAGKWLKLWDPSSHLKNAAMPMLWVTGTNDFAYPMPSLQKSYRLPTGPRTISMRVKMPHGQNQGASPEEIRVLADSVLKGQPPLAAITGQGRTGPQAWATFKAPLPIVKAELNYTRDTGKWQQRKWETIDAALDTGAGRVSATIPDGTRVYYFNLTDERKCVVSTEHETIE